MPPRAAVREAPPLYPRGPWLRSEFCCLGPSLLTTTPSASLAGTLRLHGPAAYTQRLRCAGAPRRPARPSLLSLPCLPRVPSTLRRWAHRTLPLCLGAAMPGFLELLPSRHPRNPSLPAISDGVTPFGAASFASCYGPRVCQALRTGYDELRPQALTSPSEVPCHPRFRRRPSPGAVGGQARWSNGKPPIVGTFTRPVTAASEAAQ